MRYDFDQMSTEMVYKLMSACIFPRPIAWITTLNADDSVNAAPYSFFNMMGAAPPTLAIGILPNSEGRLKDTAQNIAERSEFVVNVVTESLAESMNMTSIDAPRGLDELAIAGLGTTSSEHVAPPRISESPISFECVTLTTVMTGPMQSIVVGRVLSMFIDDSVLRDSERGHVDIDNLHLIGRTFASGYATTRDRFELNRPTWANKT